MPEVSVKLHRFDDMEEATNVADGIREAGTLTYIDASSGSTVNLSVGDVSVENN